MRRHLVGAQSSYQPDQSDSEQMQIIVQEGRGQGRVIIASRPHSQMLKSLFFYCITKDIKRSHACPLSAIQWRNALNVHRFAVFAFLAIARQCVHLLRIELAAARMRQCRCVKGYLRCTLKECACESVFACKTLGRRESFVSLTSASSAGCVTLKYRLELELPREPS